MTTHTIRPGLDGTSTAFGSPWGEGGKRPGGALRGTGRRRRVPHLLVGLLLVLVCVGAFVWITLHTDDREPVLALARAVSAGQVLAGQDLREVRVAVDGDVSLVGVDQAADLVGRHVAVSLPSGTLLSPDALAPSSALRTGQAITAVALKSGQLPAEVAAGSPVSVVLAPGQDGAAAEGVTRWEAVVVSVRSSTDEQSTVVSVRLAEQAAREVAAVSAGRLSLVLLATKGGR